MLCNTPKRYRKKTTLALGSWSRSLMTEKGTYINKASHFLSGNTENKVLLFIPCPQSILTVPGMNAHKNVSPNLIPEPRKNCSG